MIVIAPASNLAPGERRILAAGNFQRQFECGIGQEPRWRLDNRLLQILLQVGIQQRFNIWFVQIGFGDYART